VIDLHTHTTASDGRCTPEELVARAAAAGVTVLGVSDHDTVAGLARVAAACARHGLDFVPGIEITSIVDDLDVHVLGYFIDDQSPAFLAFLVEQRQRRLDRVRLIVDRLAAHGIVLDADAILAPAVADPSTSVGRPWIARALVDAGHVADTNEAFRRWLARGAAAFVPRSAPQPDEAFAAIHAAGGVASLAHPILNRRDDWIPGFLAAGLDAIEAYHSDHDRAATDHYLEMANRLATAVSGGSDYHGDPAHGPGGPGSVSLPRERFEQLKGLSVR
jgi:predicted metal-dependent phosphoesterase TrpH